MFLSLLAVVGSLYFSIIQGYIPCDLCWYQRIFMFPLPVICIHSLFQNNTKNASVIRTLSFCGVIISSYQYVIQLLGVKSNFCSIQSDCTTIVFSLFNFITLPLLSFISFMLIVILSFLIKKT
ncbi:disulfide bond formation protein B [Paenibacillus polymyxa]|uniref:disulfide bond formation protein B n=1 Tax=Paenibacillus polymyxa TaxID=1406 RepID=UPI001E5AFC7E|nr:disulfide bond formation protein B [Paenibacillus polymyxa]